MIEVSKTKQKVDFEDNFINLPSKFFVSLTRNYIKVPLIKYVLQNAVRHFILIMNKKLYVWISFELPKTIIATRIFQMTSSYNNRGLVPCN